MIVRTWLILGTLIVAGAWVLTVPLSPPPYQASPGSFADAYRAENFLPALGAFKDSEELGHEIFEVPETDAAQLAAVADSGGSDAPGMAMGDSDAAPGAIVPAPTEPQAAPSPPAMDMGKQMPAQSAPSAMPGMTANDSGAMPGMTMGGEAGEEGSMAGFGLAVVPPAMAAMAARTIEVEMGEWGFKPARVEVKPGETVRFVVRNTGQLPHEFMFMPATAMQALNYRLERADWSLTEHEAIFEQAVVLPRDSIEVTLRIMEPGSWMFMCMLPYHMQFGMMGMMMSEGAAMPAMDMGGMKM